MSIQSVIQELNGYLNEVERRMVAVEQAAVAHRAEIDALADLILRATRPAPVVVAEVENALIPPTPASPAPSQEPATITLQDALTTGSPGQSAGNAEQAAPAPYVHPSEIPPAQVPEGQGTPGAAA